jgi:hypothetical protein
MYNHWNVGKLAWYWTQVYLVPTHSKEDDLGGKEKSIRHHLHANRLIGRVARKSLY